MHHDRFQEICDVIYFFFFFLLINKFNTLSCLFLYLIYYALNRELNHQTFLFHIWILLQTN